MTLDKQTEGSPLRVGFVSHGTQLDICPRGSGAHLWHFLSYGVLRYSFHFKMHVLIVVLENGLGGNGGWRRGAQPLAG